MIKENEVYDRLMIKARLCKLKPPTKGQNPIKRLTSKKNDKSKSYKVQHQPANKPVQSLITGYVKMNSISKKNVLFNKNKPNSNESKIIEDNSCNSGLTRIESTDHKMRPRKWKAEGDDP